jgi:hypothetical protein
MAPKVPCQKNNTARSHAGNAQEDQGGAATAHARAYPRARVSLSELDPEVLVVQSAQDWRGQNTADGLDGARYRRILIQG